MDGLIDDIVMSNTIKTCYDVVSKYKKDVNPLLMHRSYVFLALTPSKCQSMTHVFFKLVDNGR